MKCYLPFYFPTPPCISQNSLLLLIETHNSLSKNISPSSCNSVLRNFLWSCNCSSNYEKIDQQNVFTSETRFPHFSMPWRFYTKLLYTTHLPTAAVIRADASTKGNVTAARIYFFFFLFFLLSFYLPFHAFSYPNLSEPTELSFVFWNSYFL